MLRFRKDHMRSQPRQDLHNRLCHAGVQPIGETLHEVGDRASFERRAVWEVREPCLVRPGTRPEWAARQSRRLSPFRLRGEQWRIDKLAALYGQLRDGSEARSEAEGRR